jgi:hypothetical protein
MSLFLLAGLVMALWFAISVLVVLFLYACALHWQERRERALEATARWHCPATLPEDWDLSREIR